MYRTLFLLMFFFIAGNVQSQVLPKEGSKLNYRIIGFSVLSNPGLNANNYKIEIALGNFNSEDSFKKHIISKLKTKNGKVIAEVPFWGCQYTWRVVFNDKLVESNSSFYHFTTLSARGIDTSLTRLKILKRTKKYRDSFVFIDDSKVLYDMQGKPVWFMPNIGNVDIVGLKVRDLKMSPEGTITFLTTENHIYEIDYNANILWLGSGNAGLNNYSSDFYHHEFTRLNNGHYMVIAGAFVPWKIDDASKKGILLEQDTMKEGMNNNARIDFGRIVEYDKTGHTIWSWNGKKYFRNFWLHSAGDSFNIYNDVHPNSFSFDEQKSIIYLSFKNISQIIKIKYPEGDILAVYGNPSAIDSNTSDKYLFSMQHACKVSKKGYLYVFNNNIRYGGKGPEIIEAKEKGNNLESIWQYDLPSIYDKNEIDAKPDNRISVGGNVIEMSDNVIFTSSCSPFGNVLIVNKKKKLLWDAVYEKRENYQSKWMETFTYRASILSNKDMKKLIWSSKSSIR